MFNFFLPKKQKQLAELKRHLNNKNIQHKKDSKRIKDLESQLANLRKENDRIKNTAHRELLIQEIIDRDKQIFNLEIKNLNLNTLIRSLRHDKYFLLKISQNKDELLIQQYNNLKAHAKHLELKLNQTQQNFNDKLLQETIKVRKTSMAKIIELIKSYHELNTDNLQLEIKTLRNLKTSSLKKTPINDYHLKEINRLNRYVDRLKEKYETLIFHFENAGFCEHREKTDNIENLFGISAHKEAMKYAYLIEMYLNKNTK